MNSLIAVFAILLICNCAAMVVFYRIMRARFSPSRILRDLRSEVDKLIVDLGREADRDVALLESRVQNLRSLIDEADRRILLASRESAKKGREESIMAESLAVTVAKGRERAETGPSGIEAPRAKAPPVSDNAGAKPSEPARPAKIANERPITVYTRPDIRRSEKQIEPVIPTRERVIDMARKGFTAQMISSTLSLPLGEVELILDLNSSSL